MDGDVRKIISHPLRGGQKTMAASEGLCMNIGKENKLMNIKIFSVNICIINQQMIEIDHGYIGLNAWKRLILIAGMLLPGGSLAALVPSQTVYAQIPSF